MSRQTAFTGIQSDLEAGAMSPARVGRSTTSSAPQVFRISLGAICLLLLPAAAFADGVAWGECDLDGALSSGKPVMVEIYARWCTACRVAERSTFLKKEFAEAAAAFSAIRCDGETGKGAEIFEKYRVTAFPTLLFLDSKGKEIDRLLDLDDAAPLAAEMKDIAAGKSPLAELSKRADKEKDNLKLWYDVGARWAFRADEEKAKKYLGKILKDDQDNKKGLASKAVYALGKYLFLRGVKKYDSAADQLEQIKRWFPTSPEAKGLNPTLATAFLKAKREGQAVKMMRKAIEENPTEATPYAEFAWFAWRNNYKLEEGLENARKATGLNPKDPEIWDLQAEILFALNKADEAAKSAEEAQKLKADEPYYKEQVERFKKGKK
ncbi:MAG: thioredoxin family protein [Deltaproteobacteria bacterium]|nr:thioredoxin family protein [Deltaproteobacteria bacterium]